MFKSAESYFGADRHICYLFFVHSTEKKQWHLSISKEDLNIAIIEQEIQVLYIKSLCNRTCSTTKTHFCKSLLVKKIVRRSGKQGKVKCLSQSWHSRVTAGTKLLFPGDSTCWWSSVIWARAWHQHNPITTWWSLLRILNWSEKHFGCYATSLKCNRHFLKSQILLNMDSKFHAFRLWNIASNNTSIKGCACC